MDLAINIVCFGAGALSIYLTAYLKIKGKNKAILEDNHKLEEEKQQVIAKYRAETEELKKRHALDIEKRKFQYEDKRAQFSKYFSLLDEFNNKHNSVFLERFQPMMKNLLSGYLIKEESLRRQALINFNEDVQALVFELNEDHLKVKTEQNSIRLITSSKMDTLLDELEVAVKNATDSSAEILNVMSTSEFWVDQTIIKPYQEKLTTFGLAVQSSRDALKEQMKLELNEI
ncbi:hypothetical protein [Vibrio ouci]|uniref:Uncharacterized protein n=1 Tax=Vibrio ouci TaxID=2499078 RepID=A0A4Y8WAZ4_9VIBR|nr:hypothetical protein [Vibrio ouci]TFH89451.1 hypothetical protein ELS82_22210 [Vibrio ouci]